MRQAARMYMETQVTTTSQGQVLIMLYDGAIKFLNQAKERIAARDFAGKGKLISSAIDVINELASSLNAEKGGALAENLNQLYFYCNKRLFMANSRMDPAAIDEVIKILGGIRSAYAQIIDTPEAVEAMAKAPAPSAKGPRAPMGVQAAPAGAPVSAARARNAYATQVVVSGLTPPETPVAQAPENAASADAPAAQTAPKHENADKETTCAMPVAEPVPAETVAEDDSPVAAAPPDLDFLNAAPPPLTQTKRLAASNLYRKFAS